MAVTIQDVAREAGVSRTTVSLVLNRRTEARISAETAARVREVARRLGYQPNMSARRLRSRRDGSPRTFCVGFVLNAVMEPATAPYYTGVLSGVQLEMQSHDYHLVLGSAFKTSAEKLSYLQRLSNDAVDGWILADVVEEEIIDWLRGASVPAVVVGGGTVTSDLDCIYPDDTEAARQVTQHLFFLGHRRFAFVSYHSHSDSAKARLLGYRQALEESGIASEAAGVYSVGTESEELTAWLQKTVLSDRAPTAVIALDDRQALALMKTAQAQGLEVPRDLSVVGFDDIPMAALWEPPLTTIRMPMRDMGAGTFRRLLERMERPGLPAMKMALPVELVVRGSTAPPQR